MAPNAIDSSFDTDAEINLNYSKNNNQGLHETVSNSYPIALFQNALNLLAHILIGFVVGIPLLFAFQSGLPLVPIQQHIILCVLGVSKFLLIVAKKIKSVIYISKY